MSGRWLRPTWGNATSLLSVAKQEIESSVLAGREIVVLNCMFHNVEVVPGISPYAQNEITARSILKNLEELLKFAAREAITVVGLSDLRDIIAYEASAARPLAAVT